MFSEHERMNIAANERAKALKDELALVQAKCERQRDEIRELIRVSQLAENAKLRRERDEYRKSLSNLRHRLAIGADVDEFTLRSIVSVLDRVEDWS